MIWRPSRVLAYLVVGIIPWSVVLSPNAITLVFSFGLLAPRALELTDLYSYLFVHTQGLPDFLLAWPIGVGLYVLAVGSVTAGELWAWEDRRVSAGLLVLVGLTQLTMALGLSRRLGTVALPVGTLVCWGVAWWFEWPAIVGD